MYVLTSHIQKQLPFLWHGGKQCYKSILCQFRGMAGNNFQKERGMNRVKRHGTIRDDFLVGLMLMYHLHGDNTLTCLWGQTGNTNQLLVLSLLSGNYSVDVNQGQSEASIQVTRPVLTNQKPVSRSRDQY